ncbi:proteasome subunit beta type-3-like [Grammomys surdaster]|uniref:proteasome subunit beta type-3-like n=1 Tax=Grammomys surdaster TaxID=491861 RepID=UPI0010A01425|nr:proteasome subunit beta type-3-like [Grammomys surdaster]
MNESEGLTSSWLNGVTFELLSVFAGPFISPTPMNHGKEAAMAMLHPLHLPGNLTQALRKPEPVCRQLSGWESGSHCITIVSIMSYSGGAIMAMKGKNCVAIAADRRFGIQAQMVTTNFQKISPMCDRLYIGLAGLATDIQTVSWCLKFQLNPYELKEGRQNKPYTLMSRVANVLNEKRFGPYYTEPVIAGLDPKTFKPFICSLDLIGCPMVTDDFVVSGTCSEQTHGMLESLWEPNMDPEHLSETISQAMLSVVDRAAISGMGVIVHIIGKDKITTRTLKARMD